MTDGHEPLKLGPNSGQIRIQEVMFGEHMVAKEISELLCATHPETHPETLA